jgi:hypothetical protein
VLVSIYRIVSMRIFIALFAMMSIYNLITIIYLFIVAQSIARLRTGGICDLLVKRSMTSSICDLLANGRKIPMKEKKS